MLFKNMKEAIGWLQQNAHNNSATTLTKLDLSSNHITHKGAIELALALTSNTSITELDLSFNPIVDEGAKAIAEIFQTNSSIHTLNLSSCGIGDKGVDALAEILKNNTCVTDLRLSNNHITDNIGVRALIRMVTSNFSVTEINLEFNLQNEKYARTRLKNLLERNRQLQKIFSSLKIAEQKNDPDEALSTYQSIDNQLTAWFEKYHINSDAVIKKLKSPFHLSLAKKYSEFNQTSLALHYFYLAQQFLPEAKLAMIEYLFSQENVVITKDRLNDLKLLWLLAKQLPLPYSKQAPVTTIVRAYNKYTTGDNSEDDAILHNEVIKNKKELLEIFEKKCIAFGLNHDSEMNVSGNRYTTFSSKSQNSEANANDPIAPSPSKKRKLN